MALGITGPVLRATGLPLGPAQVPALLRLRDLRVRRGDRDTCDAYGRYLIRVAEMQRVAQDHRAVPGPARSPGPVMVEDKKIAWPAQLALGGDGLGNSLDHIKHIMGQSMEALIHHFKLVTEGFRVPPGQVYSAIESPRGELGAHVVSDGGTRPYRVHFRDPSFNNLQAIAGDVRGRHGRRRDRGGGLASTRSWEEWTVDVAERVTDRDGRRRPALEVDAKEIIARYPQARSALLPLLHLVQSEEGYVSPRRASSSAPSMLGLTTAEVGGGRHLLHDVQAPPDRRVSRRGVHQHAVRGAWAATRSSPAQGPLGSATTRPPTTARSPWSTSSATRPATTRR